MEFYLFAVIVLFVLAISDLVVGVSNDAVNFLNSALGSRVASRRTIMIVVSVGVLVGVTFSSGMMEVARKGIFNPQYFYFSEVMVILLAVMLTDIFLLDLFNTFGMPTSTTVSIVFELLGAAVSMALMKIAIEGSTLGTIWQYINSSSALTIIVSILLSVVIAFIVGLTIMYISRILFSFNYQKKLKNVGIIWSGLAFAFLTYFLLFKGLKGASFVSDDFVKWIGDHLGMLILGSFLVWTLIMAVLHYVAKVNVLKLVVLFGTFSLAMAFAGNDLVNFIGVPMAGLESYKIWTASGSAPDTLLMDALTKPVRTETYLLLLAGLVMIVTLWFSKKAKSVTETEINLGRQDEGSEKFSSNMASRMIVGSSMVLGDFLNKVMPAGLNNAIEKNFTPIEYTSEDEKPAFDLVRASVNLTVASMLIAFATSLKLPLSTTYVSFMVAMGTSLADRAWGRDSAVYRVAGVINVIAGWFATAAIAFIVAAFNAWVIYKFGAPGVIFLLALLAFFIVRSFAMHKKNYAHKERMTKHEKSRTSITSSALVNNTAERITDTLALVNDIYSASLDSLIHEDRNKIKSSKMMLSELKENAEEFKSSLYSSIKRLEGDVDAGRTYLLVYDLEQDIIQSIDLIVDSCDNYVSNYMMPLTTEQKDDLENIKSAVGKYLEHILAQITNRTYDKDQQIKEAKSSLLELLEKDMVDQIDGIRSEKYGLRNSMLLFSLELETKDLIAVAARFVSLLHRS